ncbi:MAG: 3' terminal RNA ribose 2'-O-methyltransferase Hen1 [Williamsia sp.]|nr:3' terminal RNA ribose 2'-O-methyltransferase Hen1 [Williamsia sp.]
MLLTITTTYQPASDISFLFHKHPSKIQEFETTGGKAHVFYPHVSDEQCTIALLLDIDPIGLVRKSSGPAGNEFALEQYVNDRPYVASSLMSAAIAKAFSSAMNGRSKDKPELVEMAMPFRVRLAVLPVRGGEALLRHLFEPLGYTVAVQKHLLNDNVPDWGESRYFTVTLEHTITLQQLLTHLYVLIPVCDNDKHYWIGNQEVEKLLEKGRSWLPAHPARELIAMRYLKHQRRLANEALEVLLKDDAAPEEEEPEAIRQKGRMHTARLEAARDALVQSGVRTVVDLGCGEGKLLRLLLAEKGFEKILGMDISYHALEIAKDKLKLDRLPPRQQERIRLIHGSLTYRDKRIEGFEGATLVEVIEHLDEPRLAALEKVVFQYARPAVVVVTTPNAEYNVKLPMQSKSGMRHADHRFEWTRKQFSKWGERLAAQYGYEVSFRSVGDEDPEVGALSQLAMFKNKTEANDGNNPSATPAD